jgi:hypothetical protein
MFYLEKDIKGQFLREMPEERIKLDKMLFFRFLVFNDFLIYQATK